MTPKMQKLKQKFKGFLIWSQKYTQTDMIYLAKGGFWLSLGQFLSTVVSFLLLIAFANLLDPVTYGNYKYILSLVGILGIFVLSGMGTAITQAVARGLEGSFYTGFKTKLKWGLLGSLAAIGLAGYYFFKGNYILPVPLLISALFLPLMLASQIYSNFLGGKKLFNIQAKYGAISQIIPAGAIITALFLTKNLFWLIAVYFISHTFLNYFFYLLTKSTFKPNKKRDSETLSYGKHLSLIGFLDQIAFYLDRVLVFHYLGAVELAIYQFAIIPPEQIKGFFKNIQPLSLPKFVQKTKEEIKKTIVKKIGKFFLFLLPFVTLYILIAPSLYRIFFPQYLSSIFYSQIFAISLLSAPAALINSALRSQKAQLQIYQISITGSITQIGLLFFLTYFYGLLGVILAKIIFRFINLGLSLFFMSKV